MHQDSAQPNLLSPASCSRSISSQQDLLRLSRYGELRRLDAGEVLWTQGDEGAFLVLVLSGELVSLRGSNLGSSRLVLGRHHKGAVVGAAAVLGQRPHPASVEVRQASALLFLSREQLQRLAEEDSPLACRLQVQLWHAAAHQIDGMLERLAALS